MSHEKRGYQMLSTSTMNNDVYYKNTKGISRICEALAFESNQSINFRKVAETIATALGMDGADIHFRTITGDYFRGFGQMCGR